MQDLVLLSPELPPMTVFRPAIPCPPIPDNLLISQFILCAHHPIRPHRSGNVPWIIDDGTGRKIGFDETLLRTHGLANALRKRWGVGDNDVVCVFSPNHVDYGVAIWSAHTLGAIVSCANPSYTAEELAYQLTTIKALVLVAHPDSISVALEAARQSGIAADHIFLMDELRSKSPISFPTISDLVKEGSSGPTPLWEQRLSPGEGKTKVAFLSFSSGTSGKPKAVAISHYAVIAQVLQLAACYRANESYTSWDKRRFRPGDVALAVLPFFHIYGLAVILHGSLFCGLTIVVVSKFNLVESLASIERYRITHLFLVPPIAVLLCKQPIVKEYDLSHIRFCISGAAPLSKELIVQLIRVLPNAEIGQGYGMTETSIAIFPLEQRIGTLGSVGQLMPGCLARVVKNDGSLADYEDEGELQVAGPQIALGYMNDEKATRETFVDGWLRTGDLVKFAKNGDIFIIDRLKEVIKVRGFQVAPAELEDHLLDHPDVSDACVIGIPDDYSGEVPLAFIVLDSQAAGRANRCDVEADKVKQSIMKHVSDAKVHYKWLKGVELVEFIPKNSSGKLLRREMRDRVKDVITKRAWKAKL